MDIINDAQKLQGLRAAALELGFDRAYIFSPNGLSFEDEVRSFCTEGKCDMYDKRWSCPPACGELDEISKRAGRYRSALLVQSVARFPNGYMKPDGTCDWQEAWRAEDIHKERFERFIEVCRAAAGDILPMGAGACRICETCTYPSAPCRHPERLVVSMEAYGLNVGRVCELAGAPMESTRDTIAFVSMVLL